MFMIHQHLNIELHCLLSLFKENVDRNKGLENTRGESEESVVRRRGSTQARESNLALKSMADVTRSPKQGYLWPHKKDLCPIKI